jgi:hypothetical protein
MVGLSGVVTVFVIPFDAEGESLRRRLVELGVLG